MFHPPDDYFTAVEEHIVEHITRFAALIVRDRAREK